MIIIIIIIMIIIIIIIIIVINIVIIIMEGWHEEACHRPRELAKRAHATWCSGSPGSQARRMSCQRLAYQFSSVRC